MSNTTISVLWYTDGDQTVVARAYEDEERAREDFELVKIEGARTWTLTDVPFYRLLSPSLVTASKETKERKPRAKKPGLAGSVLGEKPENGHQAEPAQP